MISLELAREHAWRLRVIVDVSITPIECQRRLVRENIRYERVCAAIRSYYLGIEEWTDEGMV